MERITRGVGSVFSTVGVFAALSLMQGCIATRDWVREQVDPVSGRVSQSETRINQAEGQIGSLGGRMTGAEGKLGQVDGRIGQVDAKTDKALNALANLRLERRFVIDMKDGANFGFNSSNLPTQAKKELDGFLSDLKGDPAGMEGAVFLVAGHTDGVGTEDYNYELGKKRADTVSRYLITQKKMDPLRVVTVSYGKTAPAAENNTAQGRAKNRRVEILIYRDAITSAAIGSAPEAEPRNTQRSAQQTGETLTRR
jgi:peptidoglycan-associated lipoprotein